MKKTAEESAFLKNQKLLLGQAIKAIRTDDERGYVSLRKMEDAVGIPASNIKYIEDGVNAPSPEVYEAIVRELNPTDAERKELDRLYIPERYPIHLLVQLIEVRADLLVVIGIVFVVAFVEHSQDGLAVTKVWWMLRNVPFQSFQEFFHGHHLLKCW